MTVLTGLTRAIINCNTFFKAALVLARGLSLSSKGFPRQNIRRLIWTAAAAEAPLRASGEDNSKRRATIVIGQPGLCIKLKIDVKTKVPAKLFLTYICLV